MQAVSKYAAFQEIFSKPSSALILVILMMALIAYTIYIYFNSTANLNNTANYASRIQLRMSEAETNYNNDYVLKRKGIDALVTGQLNNPYFINFYILTANMAGLYTPALNGVYDPSALKYALRAGARGFVFDIYSGTKEQNYAPMLQVLQSGSSYKTQTMNQMPLALALQTLRKEGFENSSLPNYQDPMVLYFRFRGTIITTTLALAAAAVRATLEDKRVSTSMNDSIPVTPIINFKNKFILFSNMNNTKTAFDDYNNNKPGDGVINSYDPKSLTDLKTTSAEGTKIINNTKSVYCISAPLPEDYSSNDNSWNINDAENLGINMIGFNLFSYDNGLIPYLTENQKFEIFSFFYKPNNLLYIPVSTTPPVQNNTNNGDGVPKI